MLLLLFSMSYTVSGTSVDIMAAIGPWWASRELLIVLWHPQKSLVRVVDLEDAVEGEEENGPHDRDLDPQR